jgi:hypothetical protein
MDYKPGEHPLADILNYRIETYGVEADIYIRAIWDYIGPDATFAWWEKEIGRDGNSDLALQKAGTTLDELQAAERRGKGVAENLSNEGLPKASQREVISSPLTSQWPQNGLGGAATIG